MRRRHWLRGQGAYLSVHLVHLAIHAPAHFTTAYRHTGPSPLLRHRRERVCVSECVADVLLCVAHVCVAHVLRHRRETERECARVEPVSSPCGETRLFQQFSVLCALRVLNNIFIFILSLPLDGITHATYCSCHVLLMPRIAHYIITYCYLLRGERMGKIL